MSGGGRIEGATITILDGANAGSSIKTNANGEYSFTGLKPGNSNLSATGPSVIYTEQRLGIYINGSNTLNFIFPVPSCQVNNTGTVSFGNRSATTAQDIVWDGVRLFSLAPGQTTDPITAAAGVAHALQFKIANTNSRACSDSTPILTQCSLGRIITCSGP